MQRHQVLLLAVLGVVALSVVAVATATALPSVLNKAKEEAAITFTGKGGATQLAILNGAFGIECASQTNEGEVEGKKPLGSGHIKFEGCKVKGTTSACTGLGEATGVVLALSTFHIVATIVAGILSAAGYSLITTPIHFACTVSGITKLLLGKGELLCAITPTNVFVKEGTVKCEKGAQAGDPGLVKYLNAEGKEVELKEGLLISESDGGEFKMASTVGESSLVPSVEAEIMA